MSPPRRSKKSVSGLENIRLNCTELTQDEWVFMTGFKRATYQRMVSGKTATRLTLEQIHSVCKVAGISLQRFFEEMGEDISDIPPS